MRELVPAASDPSPEASLRNPGQFYLFVFRDKDGNPLNGAETYCLHLPRKPPVQQYWSAVLYDFASHAFIRDMPYASHAFIRDMPYASRSSQSPGLQTYTDGSVDVYFASKAPDGKESNWIPTDVKGRFEALFRFHGPDKSLFDHTWVLPDIEKVNVKAFQQARADRTAFARRNPSARQSLPCISIRL